MKPSFAIMAVIAMATVLTGCKSKDEPKKDSQGGAVYSHEMNVKPLDKDAAVGLFFYQGMGQYDLFARDGYYSGEYINIDFDCDGNRTFRITRAPKSNPSARVVQEYPKWDLARPGAGDDYSSGYIMLYDDSNDIVEKYAYSNLCVTTDEEGYKVSIFFITIDHIQYVAYALY